MKFSDRIDSLITEVERRDPDHADYAASMVPGFVYKDKSSMTKDEFFEDQMAKWNRGELKRMPTRGQAASTQRVLSMSGAELEEYRNRPMPSQEDAMHYKKDKDGNFLLDYDGKKIIDTGGRSFSPNEVAVEMKIRQASKNTKGDAASSGATSASQERKELASSAFTCTPPATLLPDELARIQELKTLETVDSKIENKKTFLDRAKDALYGFFGGDTRKPKRISRDKYGDLIYHYEDEND